MSESKSKQKQEFNEASSMTLEEERNHFLNDSELESQMDDFIVKGSSSNESSFCCEEEAINEQIKQQKSKL